MKKIISLALALFLIVSLSVTAFAAPVADPEYFEVIETDKKYTIVYRYNPMYIYGYTFDTYDVYRPDSTTIDFLRPVNPDTYTWNGSTWVKGSASAVPDFEVGGTQNNVYYSNVGKVPITKYIAYGEFISADTWGSYYNDLTEQITVANVVQVIIVGVGIVIGLVFMWWGVRKIRGAVMSAFKKGKISL